MREVATAVLLLTGAVFMLLSALGVVRMPDLLTRMQSLSKASTLGVSCVALAVAVRFEDLGVSMRAAAVILFAFLTTPVAAHLLARAGYFAGVPLHRKTVIDELGRGDAPADRDAAGAPDDGLTG